MGYVVHIGDTLPEGHCDTYGLRRIKNQAHWFKMSDTVAEQVGLGAV
jgi:hypothetical protein